MKDTGTVRTIEGERITLVCGAGEMCRSCKANSFCSAKTREVAAANPRHIELRRGDQVEFFIPPGRTILAGFMVLIFPLLTFILAFVISGALRPESGEGLRALYGVIGMAIGFGGSFLYSKLTTKKNVPEVMRKVQAPDKEAQ